MPISGGATVRQNQLGVKNPTICPCRLRVRCSLSPLLSLCLNADASLLQAQLGDSWLSPDVGYLLLHTLCPALYGLVEDGLKPFQKDVITGQRRNSPWSLVEASVKTGRCGECAPGDIRPSTSRCLGSFSSLGSIWVGLVSTVIFCILCVPQGPIPALCKTSAGMWLGWPLSTAQGRSFMPLSLAF